MLKWMLLSEQAIDTEWSEALEYRTEVLKLFLKIRSRSLSKALSRADTNFNGANFDCPIELEGTSVKIVTRTAIHRMRYSFEKTVIILGYAVSKKIKKVLG